MTMCAGDRNIQRPGRGPGVCRAGENMDMRTWSRDKEHIAPHRHMNAEMPDPIRVTFLTRADSERANSIVRPLSSWDVHLKGRSFPGRRGILVIDPLGLNHPQPQKHWVCLCLIRGGDGGRRASSSLGICICPKVQRSEIIDIRRSGRLTWTASTCQNLQARTVH